MNELVNVANFLSNVPEMQQLCFARCLTTYLDTHPNASVEMLQAIDALAEWSESVMDALDLERA